MNAMPEGTGRSFARILLANVLTPFNGIVGGGFVLLLLLGSWQDALFGFSVVANTVVGVVQEFGAKRTLARLAVLHAPGALVRRDGVEVLVAVEDVVLGDLLVLRPGDQVAADAVLVASSALEVDESLLTGEAEPVSAADGRELLSGSTVVVGSALARVVRVGSESYSARITLEARRFSVVRSELRTTVARIIRWLSLALLPIGAVVVNGQMQAFGGWPAALADGAWRTAAVASVASIIAMVPAGLVLMTSVALAVGAVRLARGRVLIRELGAVEGLARVDILCIDKTGTLTQGAMALDRIEPVDDPPAGWRAALAALTTDRSANATAQAIAATLTPAEVHGGPSPDAVVPFSSRHKWSGASFTGGASPGSWVLGGADVVLAEPHAALPAAAAATGARTLVLAHSPHPLPEEDDRHAPRLPPGLEPAAVIVLREQVRPDAADTIRYFGAQGVEVCVISGDEPGTVAAIAHEVGLPAGLHGIDGRGLPGDETGLAAALRTERIFGRVTPEQKRSMVIALQSLGRTVAMVGDGVNDTLALKHADLGIAMGSGSAAARAVAHVVLLDGTLARLPGVVAEGRRVIANVELLAKLFLSKTVYAIVLAVTFGLLLLPFPFLPRQLSVVDGLTIGLPGLVLALLPNARIFRLGFLRRAARFCVPAGAVIATAVIAVVLLATAGGATRPQTKTAAVITLTLSALWVLVVLARPFTRPTAAVVTAAYAGIVAVVLLPPARDFLRLEPPPIELLVVAVGASIAASALLQMIDRRSRRSDRGEADAKDFRLSPPHVRAGRVHP